MIKIEKKQRSAVREFFVILLKLLIFVVLLYFNFDKPEFYHAAPFIAKASKVLLFFMLASFSVSVLRYSVIYLYIRKNRLVSNIKDNFILGINRIVSVFNTLFLVFSVMYLFDIDPLKFVTSITIVAAAIALIFKDYVTNMINGLIIMFSDRLSLGDHIKVLNEEGKILDITLLNIVLQNEDNDMVLIPNSVIITSLIVNQSKQNIKKLTEEFEMDLAHGYTPDSLEEALWPSIKSFSKYIRREGFSVKTLDIKKDVVRFKIQLLFKDHTRQTEREIRRALNTAILGLSAKEKSVKSSA
jgi:small-conductance mechanosensitive channel